MLLRAEDQAEFQGRIDDKGATVWASYRIEGRVEGKPVVQSDKRMAETGPGARKPGTRPGLCALQSDQSWRPELYSRRS